MRKRYVVRSRVNGEIVTEGFTAPAIQQMKSLNMLTFKGTRRFSRGVVYEYVPRVR